MLEFLASLAPSGKGGRPERQRSLIRNHFDSGISLSASRKGNRALTSKNVQPGSRFPLASIFNAQPRERHANTKDSEEDQDIRPPRSIIRPSANDDKQRSLDREADSIQNQHDRVDFLIDSR